MFQGGTFDQIDVLHDNQAQDSLINILVHLQQKAISQIVILILCHDFTEMIYCNYCLCLVTDAETGNQLLDSERLKNMYYVIVLVALTQENVISIKYTA